MIDAGGCELKILCNSCGMESVPECQKLKPCPGGDGGLHNFMPFFVAKPRQQAQSAAAAANGTAGGNGLSAGYGGGQSSNLGGSTQGQTGDPRVDGRLCLHPSSSNAPPGPSHSSAHSGNATLLSMSPRVVAELAAHGRLCLDLEVDGKEELPGGERMPQRTSLSLTVEPPFRDALREGVAAFDAKRNAKGEGEGGAEAAAAAGAEGGSDVRPLSSVVPSGGVVRPQKVFLRLDCGFDLLRVQAEEMIQKLPVSLGGLSREGKLILARRCFAGPLPVQPQLVGALGGGNLNCSASDFFSSMMGDLLSGASRNEERGRQMLSGGGWTPPSVVRVVVSDQGATTLSKRAGLRLPGGGEGAASVDLRLEEGETRHTLLGADASSVVVVESVGLKARGEGGTGGGTGGELSPSSASGCLLERAATAQQSASSSGVGLGEGEGQGGNAEPGGKEGVGETKTHPPPVFTVPGGPHSPVFRPGMLIQYASHASRGAAGCAWRDAQIMEVGPKNVRVKYQISKFDEQTEEWTPKSSYLPPDLPVRLPPPGSFRLRPPACQVADFRPGSVVCVRTESNRYEMYDAVVLASWGTGTGAGGVQKEEGGAEGAQGPTQPRNSGRRGGVEIRLLYVVDGGVDERITCRVALYRLSYDLHTPGTPGLDSLETPQALQGSQLVVSPPQALKWRWAVPVAGRSLSQQGQEGLIGDEGGEDEGMEGMCEENGLQGLSSLFKGGADQDDELSLVKTKWLYHILLLPFWCDTTALKSVSLLTELRDGNKWRLGRGVTRADALRASRGDMWTGPPGHRNPSVENSARAAAGFERIAPEGSEAFTAVHPPTHSSSSVMPGPSASAASSSSSARAAGGASFPSRVHEGPLAGVFGLSQPERERIWQQQQQQKMMMGSRKRPPEIAAAAAPVEVRPLWPKEKTKAKEPPLFLRLQGERHTSRQEFRLKIPGEGVKASWDAHHQHYSCRFKAVDGRRERKRCFSIARFGNLAQQVAHEYACVVNQLASQSADSSFLERDLAFDTNYVHEALMALQNSDPAAVGEQKPGRKDLRQLLPVHQPPAGSSDHKQTGDKEKETSPPQSIEGDGEGSGSGSGKKRRRVEREGNAEGGEDFSLIKWVAAKQAFTFTWKDKVREFPMKKFHAFAEQVARESLCFLRGREGDSSGQSASTAAKWNDEAVYLWLKQHYPTAEFPPSHPRLLQQEDASLLMKGIRVKPPTAPPSEAGEEEEEENDDDVVMGTVTQPEGRGGKKRGRGGVGERERDSSAGSSSSSSVPTASRGSSVPPG